MVPSLIVSMISSQSTRCSNTTTCKRIIEEHIEMPQYNSIVNSLLYNYLYIVDFYLKYTYNLFYLVISYYIIIKIN